MSVDPSLLRVLGASSAQQYVPSNIIEAQMERQETMQNVNIAFSIVNSETCFKHAIDGSENAREIIHRALAVLAVYMRDVKVGGQDIFAEDREAPPNESGIDPG